MAGDTVDKEIVTENVSKKYGDFEAVKSISFSIKKGTIFGLLGPNGAGKSTTIKILTCQFPPTSGTAYIGGLNTVLDAVKIKKKIGVVFESQNLYEELSVYENLNFFRQLYNSPKERINEVLKIVGMEKYQKNKVKTFSKGMKQKIMISRALLNDPEVLFLDEPGSGLDPRSAREIRQMILGLKEQGKTILITTHNMEEADFLCDFLAIIHKGSIIAMDTPGNLKKRYGEDVLMIKTVKGDIYESPLNTKASSDIFEKLSENNQISLVHSKEATIEDVFIKLTGEKLTDES
ncbi:MULTISPECIES: ABC transporter ATP-binding protein [Methanosarcina]|uniref:ABC transporter ATP-binding protein n=1 Tax=Methanosarcina barkeri CM1 TaxID=796385 RepID=A0A0G3CE51_METBA|nr:MULTISPECIES: ABC transporter ATP-binding protein [Methanosarcina]AKJ40304.1 ABC transporter ATP-binding protein [Methanosarcina barkeri CM1]OED06576.1 gliding motility protein [Methanosarcina sp. A14]